MAIKSVNERLKWCGGRPCGFGALSGGVLIIVLGLLAGDSSARSQETGRSPESVGVDADELNVAHPWDYSPYRVKVWLAGDRPEMGATDLAGPLAEYLDRDFGAVWQTSVSDAPPAVRSASQRRIDSLDYDSITAADPVLAVKRNHPDAVRIRIASDVAQYVRKCYSTVDRIREVIRRGESIGNGHLDGVAEILVPVEGDSIAVRDQWKDPDTEAILTSRAMASQLTDPEAKIIRLPIDDLVTEEIQQHDKIFIVRIDSSRLPLIVSVVEIDCLMRVFSTVQRVEAISLGSLPAAIGRAITLAFAPSIRIDEAGQKNAMGLIRAAGLIEDPHSPAAIRVNDFLIPMVRKDDRNASPIAIGPLDWSYLHVKEIDGAKVKMDLYAGRPGGLQGRKNKRIFWTAMRVRPIDDHSVIRLHAQRDPSTPLIGYEIYEKALDSIEMTLVGRTDWDGRLRIDRTESVMRLLYVKNGGAVLARLPIVPGQNALQVADLVGDDQRLRAEAYLRGTQNAIVDLIAIRSLLAARVRLRLEKGQISEARELLEQLQAQPSYDAIAGDMGKKFVQIKGRNAGEQQRIDKMFAQTREMLVKNINSKMINDLEVEVIRAERVRATEPAATDEAPAPDSD